MKKIADFFFNTTIYKLACVCALMLGPSFLLCFIPQPVSILLLLWGAAILVKDLLTQRNMFKQTGSILLLLFCLGYVVTLLLYAKNDLVSTLHVYCWAIVEFFLLFAIERKKEHTIDTLAQELYTINVGVSWVALLSGIASLVVFFTKTSIIMPDPEGLNEFWSMGIINGRNSGIFNNAIPCANAMFLGCAAALYNFLAKKKASVASRIFYAVTFLVSLLVTMTTLTRTFIYGMYAFLFVGGFAAAYQHWMQKGKVLRTLLIAFAVAAVVTGLGVGVAEAGKWAMVKSIESVPMNTIIQGVGDFDGNKTKEPTETDPSTEPSVTEPTEPSVTEPTLSQEEKEQQQKDYITNKFGLQGAVDLEREELKRLPSFLYPRDELWKIALQVIPHSPIFGFTSGNRGSSSVQFSDTDYRVNHYPEGINTYHNAYFDIAVSAGLLGLGLMLAFLALQIARTLRVLFTKRLEVSQANTRWALATTVGYLATHVLISCMFLGVLCFANVSICIYFWIAMGYISRINDLALQDREKPGLVDRLLDKMIRK